MEDQDALALAADNNLLECKSHFLCKQRIGDYVNMEQYGHWLKYYHCRIDVLNGVVNNKM